MPTTSDGARPGSPEYPESLERGRTRGSASRDPESWAPAPPGHCQLYIPGHSVHFIQAKLELSTELTVKAARRRSTVDLLTVDFGDEIKQYRNCDP